MSPLGCFLVVLVTVINVQQARAGCSAPGYFLRYGVGVGDTKIDATQLNGQQFEFPVSSIFSGYSASAMRITLELEGRVDVKPLGTPLSDIGMLLTPNAPSPFVSTSRLIGNTYNRYSTDPSDLKMVNSMACGPFDGVIVITFACVGPPPTPYINFGIVSYQVLIATGPTKSVIIVSYGLPRGRYHGSFVDHLTRNRYDLDSADIRDDGITIINVTGDPRQAGENVFPVETGGPCPATAKTCSVYGNGSVNTLNGSTVVDELTLERNFVATVDKAANKENNNPCKFFLLIRTNDAYVPVNYVRIGLGVHPTNNRKYLRKFQFSLTNDSYVKELGYSLSANKLLYQADMPYAMNDTGSVEDLGITVDVTDANDGWIIKSATCGYSFTHLWNNQDPIVTMTLDGDRYDGRIQETCAGM